MLIVSNGAQKSGSTWPFNIIRNMREFERVPEEFLLDPENPNSEIVYERLPEFLDAFDHGKHNFLLKNHFGKPDQRDALLGCKDALVVNIKRDLRDVTVSAYYYTMNLSGKKRSFENYYWTEGRYLAALVRSYHQNWEQRPSGRILSLSFERLKEDPVSEIRAIGRFIGITLSDTEIERILEKTSMSNLRKTYKDDGEIKFFRKGETGDWKNHFKGTMLNDISRIMVGGLDGLNFSDWLYARVLKELYGRFAVAR